jgi:hypothetical protein
LDLRPVSREYTFHPAGKGGPIISASDAADLRARFRGDLFEPGDHFEDLDPRSSAPLRAKLYPRSSAPIRVMLYPHSFASSLYPHLSAYIRGPRHKTRKAAL